jgi:hypothetical protein
VCENKVKEDLKNNPKLKNNNLNYSKICRELCLMDSKYPPVGLWEEYYKKPLKEIINVPRVKRITGL